MTDVLVRRHSGKQGNAKWRHARIQGRRPRDNGADIGVEQLLAKERQAAGTARGQERERASALVSNSSLRNCKKIEFYVLSHPVYGTCDSGPR